MKKKLYTVSSLSNTLTVRKSRREGKSLSIFMITFVLFMLFGIVNLPTIQSFLPLNYLMLILILLFIGTFLSAQITILFSKQLRERARNVAMLEGDNQTFSIENVWSISTGGITPINTKIGETLTVKYLSECLIIKSFLSNAIERDEATVDSHYSSMAKMIDKIVENNFSIEIVTLNYDSKTDDIWESDLRKINNTNLGSKYSSIYTTISKNLYEASIYNSTVTVNYYIIRSHTNSLCTLNELLSTLLIIETTSRVKFLSISLLEFKAVLEQYYGVDIHLEDIQSYITDSVVRLGQTKLLRYSVDGVNFITVNKSYDYESHLPIQRNLDGQIIKYKFKEDNELVNSKPKINPIKDIDLLKDELI